MAGLRIRRRLLYGTIAVAVLLVVCVLYFSFYKPSGTQHATSASLSPTSDISSKPTPEQINKTKTVLLDQVTKENISVSDDQVQQTIDNGLSSYNMSMDEFVQKLSAAGMTYDDYKKALKSQIAVSELVSEHVNLTNITVTDAEVDDYFNANKDAFADFENNPDAMAMLKLRIKEQLLQQKQQVLVQQYVKDLSN